MNKVTEPLSYFNRWLAEPIVVPSGANARCVVDALNRHPMAKDQTAQDYVMPMDRYYEVPENFRIFGENQDTFFCFLRAGFEDEVSPPVFFETCLDLKVDHGFSDSQIINGDHIEVCPRFTDFLWHILAHYICIRMEFNPALATGVNGIVFDDEMELGSEFVNFMGTDFPSGYTCFTADAAICCPLWGAAFLNRRARQTFVERYSPKYYRDWGAE